MTDGWVIALISLAGSTVLTSIIGVIVKRSIDKFFDKKEKEEEEKKIRDDRLRELEAEKQRQERKEDVRVAIEEAVEPIKQDLAIIKKGTQAGLRHDLCLMADEWISRGYCPRNVKVDFDNLYTQYHMLGKNGVMDNTYQAILSLPDKLPKKTSTSTAKKTTKTKKVILNERVEN